MEKFKGEQMGSKADFYIGDGKDSKWIGSIFKNGDVYNIPFEILIQVNKMMFEELVIDFLINRNGVIADRGEKWDHPWHDSRMTDYSYIFSNNKEKVIMYQQGVTFTVDPIKVVQGFCLDECIEEYQIPEFPMMIPEQMGLTEILLKQYGFPLTSSI